MKTFLSIVVIAALSLSTAVGISLAITVDAEEISDSIVETAYNIYATEPTSNSIALESSEVNFTFADNSAQENAPSNLIW